MAFDLQAKLSRMEHIKREKPAYRSLLDFYEKISMEKDRCHQVLTPSFAVPDEEQVLHCIEKGLPVLDRSAVQFDIGILVEFFERLLYLSREKTPDAAATLALHLEEDRSMTSNLIRATWDGKLALGAHEAEELGDPTLLSFLLIECVKPLYEYCAQVLQDLFDFGSWGQGYCPVCGGLPPIAEIALQQRARRLFCISCGTGWSFPPAMCPFCEHEMDDVKYLQVENEKQYRLDVCTACGKYLKTVDSAFLGCAIPLDVEHIVTLHLDILAQQHGYRRGSSFPLLV